jgi:glycine/D-amino acid oxidase-like deaminating enzyme
VRGSSVSTARPTTARLDDGYRDTTSVECEYVVNCTGMWARELGERSGVVIPNQAAEHYYLITDTIEGIDPNAPIFEDPASVRLLPRGGRRHDGRPLRAARRRVVGRTGSPGPRASPRSSPTGTG